MSQCRVCKYPHMVPYPPIYLELDPGKCADGQKEGRREGGREGGREGERGGGV